MVITDYIVEILVALIVVMFVALRYAPKGLKVPPAEDRDSQQSG